MQRFPRRCSIIVSKSSERRNGFKMKEMTQVIGMMAGPYLIVTGLGFLLSTNFYERMVAGNANSDRITLNLSGAVHFLVGLAIVLRHFHWASLPEVIVTLIGIAALLKGMSLIAVPELTLKSPKNSKLTLRISGAVFILTGGYLGFVCYFP